YSMDISLDEFLRQLNPSLFYRANRQYIVSHRAITDLSLWFNGKLSVNLSVATPERIIVSRARSNEFKAWYMENAE
ncbi:MAG TPA: DNA-binding response regulator, partial [Porphyromonadaceae bacterium]|nr:DNA-binding response regulator [Porphyromonadaceae bacterium]